MAEKTQRKPRLTRSSTDRVFGGVCGGIAEYFAWDSTLVRLIFILLALSGGFGIVLYVILWILMPSGTSTAEFASQEAVKDNLEEFRVHGAKIDEHVRSEKTQTGTERLVGIVLLVLGGLLLLQNIGIAVWAFIGKLWPIILIIIGLALLARRTK